MIDLEITNRKFRSLVEEKFTTAKDNYTGDSRVWMDCRAKWSDGVTSKTISAFHVTTKYEALYNEMPIQSLRYINYRLAIDEMDWIYKKKSNNVNDLNSKIWNQWASEDGTIGKGYGYQVAKKVYDSKLSDDKIDQIDNILENLILDPTNRRLLINLFNIDDLSEMNLAPCAYETFFMVEYLEDSYGIVRPKLNVVLNQRSGDFIVAAHPGGWNEFQYYFLYRLIADLIGFELGTFIHNTYNLHLYNRHIDIVDNILEVEELDMYHFIKAPFEIKEEIRKEINNTRLRYIKTDDLILDSGRGVYNVITLDNLDEVHRKNYAKEIIDIYYKYNFTDWYDFTKLDSDLKDIAIKVTKIPVAE